MKKSQRSVLAHHHFLLAREEAIVTLIELLDSDTLYEIELGEDNAIARNLPKVYVGGTTTLTNSFRYYEGKELVKIKQFHKNYLSVTVIASSISLESYGQFQRVGKDVVSQYDYMSLVKNIKPVSLEDLPLWVGSEYVSSRMEKLLKGVNHESSRPRRNHK